MVVLCYVVCIVFNITVVLSDVSRFLLEVVDVLVAAGCVFVFVILFDVVGALLYAAGLFVVGYVSVNCAGIRVDVASLLVEILLVLLLMLLEFLLMLLVFMLMFPFEFLLLIFVMLFWLLLF